MDFTCRLGTPEGRVVEQRLAATSEQALRLDLEQRGYHVFEIRSRSFSLRPSLFGGGRTKRVSPRQFLVFNQELAALLRSGLPLLQALELMLERLQDPNLRAVLSEIRDKVKSGQDLSEAFASYGEIFPRLYAPTLKAGERSGELESVIRRYIRYQQLVMDARKRTVSALVYPAVLVVLSFAMIMVMTFYVVPKFSVFFADLKTGVPLITRIVLGISGAGARTVFLLPNWIWFIVLLVAGGVALRLWVRTPQGAETVDRLKLKLPFLGEVLHLFALSEFCRSLATLLNGGMPLVPSLEIAVGAVGNASVRSALAPRIQMVREGKPFYASLEQSETFPSMSVNMVKVGEATGSLDEMLSNVADLFDEQVETRMQRILTLVEPVMLIFMGLIIGILLVSVYLPLFSAMGSVS